MYMIIKYFHMAFAAISITGFILRSVLTWMKHPVMQQKWIRIVPHINDTLLLVAAITLAVMIGQYPFVHGWLTAKVVALIIYILLGAMVIKQRGPTWFQGLAFVLAVATFAYIGWVAISHWPWPWQL